MDNKQTGEKEKKGPTLVDVAVKKGPALLSHDTQKLEPQNTPVTAPDELVSQTDVTNTVSTNDRSSVGEMNELVKIMDEKKKAEEQLKEEAEKLERLEQLVAEKKYFVETHAQKSGMLAKILVIALLLCLIGVGVYYFLQKSNNATTAQNTTPNTVPNTPSSSEFTSQANIVADFAISKNSGWTYEATADKDTGYFSVVITTNQNKQIKAYNYVGKGGDCKPAVSDTPHNIKNNCATYEELSYEKTKLGYLVKVKYTESAPENQATNNKNATTYHYCLRSSTYSEKDFKLNQPSMGFYLPCSTTDLQIDFGTDIDISSTSFFDNSEVKEVAKNLLTSSFSLKNN